VILGVILDVILGLILIFGVLIFGFCGFDF